MQRKYVYGPGIDEPVYIVSGGNTYYYYFDGLGSVVALARGDQPAEETYSYDVYGEPNRTSAVGNRYMFTGREYDSETGLYYYRARYYKPSIGRFMQTDPMGYKSGLDLYTYCGNNPIIRRDPTGLGWGDGEKGCKAECQKKYDSEFATAGWLNDSAVAGCNAILNVCLSSVCDKIPGCGKIADAAKRSCVFLCGKAHGTCIAAAYGLYLEAVAGAAFNYGVCMGACSILW